MFAENVWTFLKVLVQPEKHIFTTGLILRSWFNWIFWKYLKCFGWNSFSHSLGWWLNAKSFTKYCMKLQTLMKFDKDTRLILWGKGGPECHTSEFPFGIYWWTLKNPKNQNFEKIKKNCWRYHHFIHVYQKPQSNEIVFLRYRVRQSFWSIFCLFTPLYNPKNKNFT